MVLRYGELIPLVARHDNGWHERVLSFARYSIMETAIISINFNDHESTFWVDLKALEELFKQNKFTNNTVVMI